MTDEDKPKAFSGHHHHSPPPQPQPFPVAQYGTFQGVANYPPPPQPHPAIGVPHPVPPPGAIDSSSPPPQYYPGYQAVPGYAVAEGRPVRERRLGCCGLGCGWCLFLIMLAFKELLGYEIYYNLRGREEGNGIGYAISFILGFFLAGIPWYVGAIIMLCSRIDYREKPGYIACVVAAVLGTIAIILGVTKGVDDW